jgi:hypothetical protein
MPPPMPPPMPPDDARGFGGAHESEDAAAGVSEVPARPLSGAVAAGAVSATTAAKAAGVAGVELGGESARRVTWERAVSAAVTAKTVTIREIIFIILSFLWVSAERLFLSG